MSTKYKTLYLEIEAFRSKTEMFKELCRTCLVYSDILINESLLLWVTGSNKSVSNKCKTQAHFYYQILILVWFSELGGHMLNLLEFHSLPSMNSTTWINNIYFKSHIQDNWLFKIRKSCSNFPSWLREHIMHFKYIPNLFILLITLYVLKTL